MKKQVILSFCLLGSLSLFSCGNKPRFMHYEAVFNAPLGSGPGQIGNNMEELQKSVSAEESFLVRELLDVPASIQIHRNKIYIADKYNRKISIFQMNPPYKLEMSIPSAGEGYSFGYPFQVILNKFGDIYVVASDSITNQDEDPMQYYIYKFSYDGEFLYRIGKGGQNTGPMAYPDRVDTDTFDNLYIYQKNVTEDYEAWDVTRFSGTGELNFAFGTRYLSLTNTKKNKTYVSTIQGIFNMKNDEQLLVYNNHALIKRGDQAVSTPNEFYHSLNLYSVLQNSIVSTLMESKTDIEGILAVTEDDTLVFYSYREQAKGVRLRYVSFSGERMKQESYFARVLPAEWNHSGFYIDPKGDIYSIIVKDMKHFVVLRWKKRKSAQL